MRIIKFRAWDTFNAEMFPEKVNDDLLVKFFREVNIRRNGGNTVIVMQYTGLKDKNGKEIYEGDLLKHDIWGVTKIIWEHGMFRGTSPAEGIDITLSDHQLKRCRIIGNIYETPELLK